MSFTFCFAVARGTVLPTPPSPSLFRVDPARSKVGFELDAPGHHVQGTARQVAGEILFDPEDLSRRAEVTFEVEAAALSTANKVRDRKMRGSHLETGKYPRIVFHSSRIEAIAPTLRAGETQELSVSGVLSLHGVDRNITFPITVVSNGKSLKVTGQVPLKLSDYAIPIPRFLFLKLKDEIQVAFEVVAVSAESR